LGVPKARLQKTIMEISMEAIARAIDLLTLIISIGFFSVVLVIAFKN
jgi:hypothetical protein